VTPEPRRCGLMSAHCATIRTGWTFAEAKNQTPYREPDYAGGFGQDRFRTDVATDLERQPAQTEVCVPYQRTPPKGCPLAQRSNPRQRLPGHPVRTPERAVPLRCPTPRSLQRVAVGGPLTSAQSLPPLPKERCHATGTQRILRPRDLKRPPTPSWDSFPSQWRNLPLPKNQQEPFNSKRFMAIAPAGGARPKKCAAFAVCLPREENHWIVDYHAQELTSTVSRRSRPVWERRFPKKAGFINAGLHRQVY